MEWEELVVSPVLTLWSLFKAKVLIMTQMEKMVLILKKLKNEQQIIVLSLSKQKNAGVDNLPNAQIFIGGKYKLDLAK